jgi:hypothetical protein
VARFVCPCCGHRTLPDRPGTLAGLCEVCAWEGRDLEGWLSFSGPALLAAQRTYLRTGASDPALRDFTRAPRADEARPPWWLPLDELNAALVAELERAFAGVELAGGVSMAEANLIDDYALPARTVADPPPRGHGVGPPWQAITLADLERYAWGPFSFIDARGVRYYLPALLRFDLHGEAPGALESLVYTLTDGHQRAAIRALLDDAQRTVVARWLWYRAQVTDALGELTVRKALRAGWADFLAPEQLALLG